MTNIDHVSHLRDRYRAILAYTGLIWAFAAIPIGLPGFYALFDTRELFAAVSAGGTALLLGGVGLAMWRRLSPSGRPALTGPEGSVVVVLAWGGAVAGAAPALGAASGLTVSQAVFEATSAWTTTGLSVIDVEHASQVVLLMRSSLQLAGGAGLAILMVAAAVGPSGLGLLSAEGREDQLVPHVVRSAGMVVRLCVLYALLGIVALWLAGMTPLDAIHHSFAAVSTGGFSTRAASIGAWDGFWIEGVTIVLMLLGATNFATVYAALKRGPRVLARSAEVKLAGLEILVAAPIVLAALAVPLHAQLPRAIRTALFEVVSAVTTTGYSTTTYGSWPAIGWLVLIVLMVIGGGTGSTAGGLKQARLWLLFQSCSAELRRARLPSGAVSPSWTANGAGQRVMLHDDLVRRTGAFAFLYVVTLAIGTAVLASYGYDLRSRLFEMASSLGTVGLSVGVTSPDAPVGVLWTETTAMLLGRLEFIAVLIGVRRIAHDLVAARRGRAREHRRAQRTATSGGVAVPRERADTTAGRTGPGA